ncbi:myb-interacting protein 40 [Arctopsyche grandis]|uniref:myb-interacting protein 40 n=1 Tax=Arctopsyche grandis TaxID=121162 RepID=UPI00406D839D
MPRKRRGGGGSTGGTPVRPHATSPGGKASSDTETPAPNKELVRDDVLYARGRLRGALRDAMEYTMEDSDSSCDPTPTKRERNWNEYKISSQTKRDLNDYNSDDDNASEKNVKRSSKKKLRKMHKNNSYVMKLFDRSVDLAQFTEKTSLYPICRAWMANKPRNYKCNDNSLNEEPEVEDGIKLPPPEGHPVSRVPPLLPEQCTRSKYNINLNYNEEPPIPKDVLLKNHLNRWHAVRRKWLQQAVIYESRYARTQEILNEMEPNYSP